MRISKGPPKSKDIPKVGQEADTKFKTDLKKWTYLTKSYRWGLTVGAIRKWNIQQNVSL